MQNWNQWQLSAGAVATPISQPPVGYAASGTDPMTMMQAYMQYYNQPAPSGYTAEQWTAAQQQNWAQWQQWQQQYQQWQAQYGEKYQETMKHISAQNIGLANQVPPLPIVQPPPLPKEDAKPPLPPTTINTYQFTSMPPPHQNNLPLFPVKQSVNSAMPPAAQNFPQNPPLPTNQPPLPPESNSSKETTLTGKRSSNTVSESSSAKKLKIEDEELTEAEKTFDAQFKEWEEQFNKWKQQNANHPDKTQYKQYEAKWTSWREKLIERREQMRKKREQQKQAVSKAESEKSKNLPGDDKILNILSNTENQGLINNLLGIGKSLGLTGKQNTNVHPPPPPPPPPQTTSSNVQTTTVTTPSQVTSQTITSQVSSVNTSSSVVSSPWNSQQWNTQYNPGINMTTFAGFQSLTGVPPPPFSMPPTQMLPPNFSQPPPNFTSVTPNFSQPPPGFPVNDARPLQSNNVRSMQSNVQGKSLYGSNEVSGVNTNLLGQNERTNQTGPHNNFDSISQSSNFGMNDHNRQKDHGGPSERFNRDGINKKLSEHQGNQFRSNDDRVSDADQFRRDDRSYQEHGNNQFNSQKATFNPNNDRFTHGNERFSQRGDRFGPGTDRFGNNRFGPPNDRFPSGDDRFGSGNDRIEPSNDRFTGNSDRFGSSNEHFGPGNDRFNRNNLDNSRNFNRNNQFEPSDKLAPELKKLMEKRRAALDVFKPSYLDTDKSSNVGSLSESFKKIAGDSPFMSKNSNDFTQKEYGGGKGGNNCGPRGPPSFSPGSGNFRMPQGGPEFPSRNIASFGPRNAFDLRDGMAPPFRGSNFSPQQVQDHTDSKPDSANLRNTTVADKDNLRRENVQELPEQKIELTEPIKIEQNVDGSIAKDGSEDYSVGKDIPLLEKPPWADGKFSEQNLSQINVNKEDEGGSIALGIAPEQSSQNIVAEQTDDKKDVLNSDDGVKKTDVLPFMGENDPKPEDLNMEPPPELPNLGPVSTGAINDMKNSMQRSDEPFDPKGSSLRPFPTNSESFGPRGTFDSSFGPRGMPFRPNVPPLFGPRGPNDGRFLPFEPRGPNTFPFNPSGPGSHQLGSRFPNDGQLGARGPNDGHFGPRGPNDGQFGPRGPNDGQFGPRGPNDGHFGPRGPSDGQFGPRGSGDGQFGPRGPNDGQFGPRGTGDGQFGPRGPIEGQFGSQPSNNRQFAPCRSGDAPFDNRGPNDGQFGPKGSNEAQSNFSGPNDRFFGSRRSNDGLPYQRGPNDNALSSRGINDASFANRGPKDGPYGPRGLNDRPFDTSNDGYAGSQGISDRYLEPRSAAGAPTTGTFMPPNHADGQFTNRPPFGIRGPGDFRAKGQFDSASPKIVRDSLNEKHSELTLETSGPVIRSDGGLNLDRSIGFDGNNKMQMEQNKEQIQSFGSGDMQNPNWRQPFGKNSFGDIDQRSGRDSGYIERSPLGQSEVLNQSLGSNTEQRGPFAINKPNVLVEKNAVDSNTISPAGDFKSGYGEPSASDYAKFNSPNLFMKRSADNRQSQTRVPAVKEFCIEKQFNYNHGGTPSDKKFVEHIPLKVIDYGHTSRSSNQDYLSLVQCFDYGHGNLKPVVSDREVCPKKDFRNWEENEQNLKDYTEKIRRYEYFVEKRDSRRSTDNNQRRDKERSMDDRKSERERRERDEYKGKDRGEDRLFDRKPKRDQDNRYQNDTLSSKEKAQERCESSHKEKNKETDKDESRPKGNINWQDTSNKNVIETKPQETSVPDTHHNVLDTPPKTLELAKTPNSTMVDDLLCPPGRQNRPPKIAIILRGPPGSGKSFVAKLIKDKEVEQGGSAPRILSLDDYFLVEKEIESKDDNGKKVTVKDMVYEYEEAMEQSYVTSLVKAFKKNITDGFFNFIILDCINEKISDYEEMWSFAKTKGFKVYVCEMEMDLQICLKRNIHNRTEEEINRIIDYFEPTPSYHQKLDVNSMLQDQAIEEVHMEDSEEPQNNVSPITDDSQDSQDDISDVTGVSKWERMEAEDKLDRLDGLAKKKNEGKVQTMQDFLQVPDYYNMEDTSGKKRVRWADLEERKEQEKMRAVGFVVGHTNWDRMMDPTKGGSALTRTKFFSLS